jgi:hypothetical protein
MEDYALLIGVSSYPELGFGGKPSDLRSPPYDVEEFRKWLMDDPQGPRLKRENVRVKISDPAATAAAMKADEVHPTVDELEKLFFDLDDIATANKEAGIKYVGRRLYIYMSGHGFSPGRLRACLYAGTAQTRRGHNVHATGWLSLLQDACYFQEYVLLMDCCMDAVWLTATPRDPQFAVRTPSEPPRASFIALAAQRPLRAVEVPMPTDQDPNRCLGAFTWALTQGLRGAAADRYGRVTGRSLANWIRNAQCAKMGPEQLANQEVSKEPEVIQEDSALIFTKGIAKPRYAVTVSCPGAPTGSEAVIWTGSPAYVLEKFVVTDEPEKLSLEPGLYCINVPAAGRRQSFEVLEPVEIAVESAGPEVKPPKPGELFDVKITAAEDGAAIYLIDSTFECIEGGPASLCSRLPFGIYKVKTKLARSTEQRVFLLDADTVAQAESTPQPVAVAPVLGTSISHEYQWGARSVAIAKANSLPLPANGAALVVMARMFSGSGGNERGSNTQPWRGITVVDEAGATVLDLEKDGLRGDTDLDPWAFCVVPLTAGSYFLRQQFADGAYEQSLILCKGFRHEVHILRRVLPGEDEQAKRPRVSVLMHQMGEPPEAALNEDGVIETARLALADERRILNPKLEELLLRQFESPMAWIIGGHLLLVERDRDPGRDIRALDDVVRKLHEALGRNHPDVAALAFQCPDAKLRRVGGLIGPPMLQRSWTLLVQAAQSRPKLIPPEMYGRLVANSALPPFLIWAADASVKAGAREELTRQIAQEPPVRERILPPQDVVLPAARVDVGAVAAMLPPEVLARVADKAGRATMRMQMQKLAKMNLPPSALDVLRGKTD